MLDVDMLEAMPPKTIFAIGRRLVEDYWDASKWMAIDFVACRGGAPDWAIYYAPALTKDMEDIRRSGDKMHNPESIRKCVPCDDGALERYKP